MCSAASVIWNHSLKGLQCQLPLWNFPVVVKIHIQLQAYRKVHKPNSWYFTRWAAWQAFESSCSVAIGGEQEIFKADSPWRHDTHWGMVLFGSEQFAKRADCLVGVLVYYWRVWLNNLREKCRLVSSNAYIKETTSAQHKLTPWVNAAQVDLWRHNSICCLSSQFWLLVSYLFGDK